MFVEQPTTTTTTTTRKIMLKRCNLRRCSDTSRSYDDPIIIRAAAGNSSNDLPEEVVSLILTKLVSSSSAVPCSLADYVRFPAVSTVWRRAFQAAKIFDPPIKLPAQIPLLVIQSDENDPNTRYFYSLSSDGGKLHNFPLRGQLSHQRCCGSSYGWLFTLVPDQTHTVRLFNPFSSSEIHLPSLFSLLPFLRDVTGYAKEALHATAIRKVAFSRSPSSYTSTSNDDHLIVMVITENDDLGFCKLGDTHWTPFDSPFRPPGRRYTSYHSWSEVGFQDVIYYKGQFHAVIATGLVACLDLSPQYYPNPKLTVLDVVAQPSPEATLTCHWLKKYLVESSGDLLQVHRGLEHIDPIFVYSDRYEAVPENGHVTRWFQVFKLMDKKWVEIKSLNGWSLFLGDNTSFSLPAHNFPAGCIKPNRIYFTDDYGFHSSMPGAGPLDCGVFNLEDGSFEARSPIETKIILNIFPHWVQLMV